MGKIKNAIETRVEEPIVLEPPKLLKLDLGCGERCQEGFTGADLYFESDNIKKVDLTSFPWPWETESVDEAFSSHFLEHIPGKIRGKFMDELWRVLKPCGCTGECPQQGFCPIPGGKALIITPYWSSARSIQDFNHEWPPIVEQSYLYFNKSWRQANKLEHYLGCVCDFDWSYGYALDPETQTKNPDRQQDMIKHDINAVSDLHVTVTKRGRV